MLKTPQELFVVSVFVLPSSRAEKIDGRMLNEVDAATLMLSVDVECRMVVVLL